MYSFTKPKTKPLFSEDTKLWLIFINAVTGLMIGFSLFLLIETYIKKENIKNLQSQIIKNNKNINIFTKKIEFINKEKTLYTNITVNNQLLKDGVKNLLDLIPDPITLTNIKIEKNSLIIYGITPTKDVYNILLLPPLKSIFTQTLTNFYQMDNGWYRFESINTLKEEQ
jgi:dipeptide/tripeptide permease